MDNSPKNPDSSGLPGPYGPSGTSEDFTWTKFYYFEPAKPSGVFAVNAPRQKRAASDTILVTVLAFVIAALMSVIIWLVIQLSSEPTITYRDRPFGTFLVARSEIDANSNSVIVTSTVGEKITITFSRGD